MVVGDNLRPHAECAICTMAAIEAGSAFSVRICRERSTVRSDEIARVALVFRPPALSTISRQCRRLGRCDCYSDSLSRFGGVACGPDGTLAGIL